MSRKDSRIKFLPRNTKGRDFIIGDLHGCTAEFWKLYSRVKFDPAVDRMFCTGDLIDRGLKSLEAALLLDEPWFYSTYGNHENILQVVMDNPCRDTWTWWERNGGKWAREIPTDVLMGLYHRFNKMPFAIIIGEGLDKINIFHAEFLGTQAELEAGNLDSQAEADIIWGRTIIDNLALMRPKVEALDLCKTYVGHTIVAEPTLVGNINFIDTGAFKPYWSGGYGYLTMVQLGTDKFYRSDNL